MSREAREWVWNEAPTDDPRQMLILLSIADVANENGGGAYPSKERMASDSRSNPRTVQRHLTAMVQDGLLEVESKATGHRPTTYQIVALRGDNLSPLNGPGETEGRQRGDRGETAQDSLPLIRTGKGRGIDTRESRALTNDHTDVQFGIAWAAYPRKLNRQGALDAFTVRVTKDHHDPHEMTRAAENYRDSVVGVEQTLIMHGATFFGPRLRWKDYLDGPHPEQHTTNGGGGGRKPGGGQDTSLLWADVEGDMYGIS